MRKLFFLLVAIFATTCLWAHDFEVDGIYYNYLEGNNVKVTYKGSSYTSYTNEYSGAVTIPETVTYSGNTYSVTSIGSSAFDGCTSLTSVTIGNSVTSIGSSAFDDCTSLTSVTIGNSVTSIGRSAFYKCSSLKSITIPNSVTSIGDNAFYGCSFLASVTIGNSVTSIGIRAFSQCSKLTSVTIPNSVTSIGDEAFYQCSKLTSVTIGNSVTSIGDEAFYDCSSLTSITCLGMTPPSLGYDALLGSLSIVYIPDNTLSAYLQAWGTEYVFINNETTLTLHVEVPGTLEDLIFDAGIRPALVAKLTLTGTLNEADFTCMRETMTSLIDVDLFGITNTSGVNFNGKTKIVRIILPTNLTSIGDDAFRDCSSLTSITIPNSVTSIGNYAFYQCSFLASVTIGNSVTSIGNYAFRGCASLTSITIPESVTSIGDYAFYGCSFLASVTIGNSVTSIGDEAFCKCYSLKSITIPNSVTSIGDEAFYNCSSLTSVTIGNSVTSIGNEAFYQCSSLTSVTIGNSVTSIGNYAFYQCSSLKSITIPNSVTSIGDYAFYKCSSLTSVTIGNSVTSIGNYAFSQCSKLTSITIGNSVTSIGDYAFSQCSKLTSVTINSDAIVRKVYSSNSNISHIFGSQVTEYIIGEGVTSIGNSAFRVCSSLTSITIPNSVTRIGNYAFYQCSSLVSITCEAETPPTVGSSAFYDVSKSIPVYVPCGCIEAYKAKSGWKEFTNIQAPQEYSIQVSTSNSQMGTAKVDYNTYCEGAHISALAYDHYHFVQWSDGNSDNPRTLVLTQDTVLTAEFAPNNYTISTLSNDIERGTTSGDITTTYLDYVTISATANYGYHFVQWNDYNFDNPRQVQVKEDKTYTAYFDKNTYYITKNYDRNQGYVAGYSSGEYLDNITLTAEANYGYHFVQWSDGMTDNPRTLVLTQDTVLIAEFAPNNYTISTLSNDIERGTTSGDITTTYLDYVTISATANYGYHFVQWNDYNFDNPRQVQVKEDKTYTAYFDKNTYYITKNYDSNQGYVVGYSSGEYLDNITLTAEANYGYHFVQWSDGNTDNPRTLVLTQDTVLTAEFAINQYMVTTRPSHNERGTTQGDTTVNYLENVTISATANYGYHFVQWNDYNFNNPRQVQVKEDKTYTAYFDKNTYYITKNYDSNQGYINGSSSGEYLDNITLTAEPNYGYHFVQWSDGMTDNPRTLVLTQDTVLIAEFAPNNYTISTLSNDIERGTTSGDITTTYLDYVTISATANYGYHFVQWNDYNFDNPRQVQVKEDKTYTAYFDKNIYSITTNCNHTQGSVNSVSTSEYLDNITLTATPHIGYQFIQWSDGQTDNPRDFILTQDTTFTAEFAQSFSGQCGDNLYWSYDEGSKTISISGTGNMYDYTPTTQPWILFKEELKEVAIANTATSLGKSAFAGSIRLAKVEIGANVENIADSVFAGCNRLYHVYCYPTYPPFAEQSSFANYNVYLHVPCEEKEAYELDMIWGNFKNIECLGAESENITTDDVIVSPSTDNVTITWPTEENADTYSIVIEKDNEVFCTLTFNADGLLLNIAFAPARNGSHHAAQYAAQTAKGLRFTVTGLEEATTYAYNITAKDASDKTIKSHSGEFTTQSNTPTDVDNLNHSVESAQKLLRDGQLLILRDGKTYSVMGQEM